MLQGKYAVVLSRNARGVAAVEAAKAMAAELGVAYLDRPHNQVLEDFMAAQGLAAVIVLEKDGPRIHSEHGTFSYHPGMAEIRVQQLLRGAPDHLVKALDLHPGSRVLDCTLGLASDAAVAACVVGAAAFAWRARPFGTGLGPAPRLESAGLHLGPSQRRGRGRLRGRPFRRRSGPRGLALTVFRGEAGSGQL